MLEIYLFFVPLLFLIFYGSEICGFPKLSLLLYISGIIIGFYFWQPMLTITLIVGWSVCVICWILYVWGIFRQK